MLAARNIEKGTDVCDYHGVLLDKRTGLSTYYRDQEYGDEDTNCFKFDMAGTQFWIDAVQSGKCDCTRPCIALPKTVAS